MSKISTIFWKSKDIWKWCVLYNRELTGICYPIELINSMEQSPKKLVVQIEVTLQLIVGQSVILTLLALEPLVGIMTTFSSAVRH
jgi:hypothetical protein